MTKSIGMIVVGEIGSTETRLALCGLDVGRPVVVVDETSPNSRFAGLTAMVQAFLRKYWPPQIRAAAFVVGGPIPGGVSLAENLPWAVGSQALASELSIDKVAILTSSQRGRACDPGARALMTSSPSAAAIRARTPIKSSSRWARARASRASTGTGPSTVRSRAKRGMPTSPPAMRKSFGSRFACRKRERAARWASSCRAQGSRSYIGSFPIRMRVRPRSPSSVMATIPRRVILREAATGTDPACRRAVDLFLAICAGAAGNLALTLRATGGVYLAGDIVPDLRARLSSGIFQAAFARKA